MPTVGQFNINSNSRRSGADRQHLHAAMASAVNTRRTIADCWSHSTRLARWSIWRDAASRGSIAVLILGGGDGCWPLHGSLRTVFRWLLHGELPEQNCGWYFPSVVSPALQTLLDVGCRYRCLDVEHALLKTAEPIDYRVCMGACWVAWFQDGDTYGRHLANTIERSVLAADAGWRDQYCSNLLYLPRLANILGALLPSVTCRYLKTIT